MHSGQDVAIHGEIEKQLRMLERSDHATGRQLVDGQAGDVGAVEHHPPAAGRQRAGYHIEQCRLAGTVRSDQAEDCALVHVEGYAIQRDDAAEHDADVANREQGILTSRELCLRHIVPPRGSIGVGCHGEHLRGRLILPDPLGHTCNFPS